MNSSTSIRLDHKTRLLDINLAAARSTKDNAKQPLCLHIDDGGTLSFHAAAGPGPSSDADVKAALVEIIANELKAGPPIWQHKLRSQHRIWAGALLDSVLKEPTIRQCSQLRDVMKMTNELTLVADTSRETDPAVSQMIWEISGHAAPLLRAESTERFKGPNGGAWSALEEHKPCNEVAQLMLFDQHILKSDGKDANSSLFAHSFKLMETLFRAAEDGVIDAPIHKMACRELGQNIAVQYGFVETWMARLQNCLADEQRAVHEREVSLCANELPKVAAVLAVHVSREVFESVFLPQAALDLLKQQLPALTGKAKSEFRERLRILAKNTKRYERYLKSPLAATMVDTNGARVSHEFMVRMFERLKGQFDSERVPGRRELMRHLALRPDSWHCIRAFGTRAVSADLTPPAGEATLSQARPTQYGVNILTWELQKLLCTVDDQSAQLSDDWVKAVSQLRHLPVTQIETIFAYRETIAKLECFVYLDSVQLGEAKLPPVVIESLKILKANARRMEAFMDSDLSHNAAFDDVDRAVLIPWWEIMKDVIGAAEDQPWDLDAPVTPSPLERVAIHLPPSEPALPADTASPNLPTLPGPEAERVEELLPETDADADAARLADADAEADSASESPSESPVESPVESPPEPSTQAPREPTPERKSSPGDSRKPELSRARVLRESLDRATPAQLRERANPWRSDRPPTGREGRRFVNSAGHHALSRAKWLGGVERESLHSQVRQRIENAHRAGEVKLERTSESKGDRRAA